MEKQVVVVVEKITDDRQPTSIMQEPNTYQTPMFKKEMRNFIINGVKPKKFVNNSIKSAKYNAFTFLPLAVMYQFNNYFNMFFLITAVITSIPEISPLDPITALSPFLFVILISLVREAFEDLKKTKYDKLYNNSPTLRWSCTDRTFMKIKWADVHVGNIIKINKNEIIPCDVLVIKSSMESGFCYLETTNLDGESALKPREAMLVASTLILNDYDLNNIQGSVEVDLPNNNIYKLEGTLFLESFERSMFNIDNVLLRGGRLKNVDYVYGIVLYTGKETKIMKNIQHGSLKLSSIDFQLNSIVIYICVIVFLMCLFCTLLGAIFRGNNIPDYANNLQRADYVLYYNPNTASNNILEVLRIFAGLFIIFNTLIPISLMISYQIVKGFQIVFLERDHFLAEDPLLDKMKALSFTLHEDLGMVKYIFTDKTGTLTRNEMEFYACSIFTKSFDNEDEEENLDEKEKEKDKLLNNNNYKTGIDSPTHSKSMPKEITISKSARDFVKLKKSTISPCLDKNKFTQCLTNDSVINLNDIQDCPFTSYREAILEFFMNIALNHNVLTEIDSKTGEKDYQGSNPDEVTLVTSAAELGIEFLEREGNKIRLKVLDKIEKFEVIQKMEFSSSRMRSSIIVRDSNGNYKLYMKGADTKIFEKLDKFSTENLLEKSKAHLDSFAKRGLRTLCYSYKFLNEAQLNEWERRYKDLKYQAINDKSLEFEVEKHITKIEDNMMLLGVSALEDKLQDEVKSDLQNFIEAGINVWMITGDKMDTAESIGYSCRLFNNDTEVFKIKKSENIKTTIERMKEIMSKMSLLQKELEDFKNLKDKTEEKLLLDNKLETRNIDLIIDTKNTENFNSKNKLMNNNLISPKRDIGQNSKIFANFNKKNGINSNLPDKFFTNEKNNISVYPTEHGVPIQITQNNLLKSIKPNDYQLVPNKKTESDSPINKLLNIDKSYQKNVSIELKNIPNERGYSIEEVYQFKPDKSNYFSTQALQNKDDLNEQGILSIKEKENSSINLNKLTSKYDVIFSKSQSNFKGSKFPLGGFPGSNGRTVIRNRFNSSISNDIVLKANDMDEVSRLNLQDIDDQTIMNFIIDKNLEISSVNDANLTFMNNFCYRNNNENSGINLKEVYENEIKYDPERELGILETDKKKEDDGNLDSIHHHEIIRISSNVNSKNLSRQNTLQNGVDDPFEIYNNNNNFDKIKKNSSIFKKDERIGIDVNKEDISLNYNNIKNNKDYNPNIGNTINGLLDKQIQITNSKKFSKETHLKNKAQTSRNNHNDPSTNALDENKFRRSKTGLNAFGRKLTELETNRLPRMNLYDPQFYNRRGTNFQNIITYLEDEIEKIDNRKKSMIPIFNRKKTLKTSDEELETRNILINFGLIIEGEAIDHCLSPEVGDLFWNLMKKCRSVIACRCSPLQKANIVSFVKKTSKKVTLAIGDGGNDVNMIKTANIGVGIFGKEGYQAAYSSDFAISQFKYLKRLIFTHGRFSLERNSYFIYFFFFKNIMFSMPQFWLCFFSAFSGVNFYDQWFYLGYNSFMTAFPVGAKALLEEDIDMDTQKQPDKQIMRTEYRDSKPFNKTKFFLVFVSAFAYSFVIYFVPFFNFKYNMQDSSGKAFTYWDHSLCSFLTEIAIHFFVLFEDSYLNTWFNLFVYFVQISIIFVFLFIHNMLNSGEISGILFDLIADINFWFTFIITTSICLIPFYIIRRVNFFSSDNIINNLKQKNYEDDYKKKYLVKGLEGMSKNLRYVVKFKKILQGDVVDDDNYANKRVKQLVEQFQSTRKIKGKKKEVKVKRAQIEFSGLPKRSVSFINLKYDVDAVMKNSSQDVIDINSFVMQKQKHHRNSNLSGNKKIEKAEINIDYNLRDR